MDYSFLDKHKIIPVAVLNSVDEAYPKLSALFRGGIQIAEITFRTACAEQAIKIACESLPDMLIGAGTVINELQCAQAIAAGARFVVSPGFSPQVYKVCKENGMPYLSGAVTPSEIMAAKSLGMEVIKFFPAQEFGGIKTIKALSAAFPDMRFVPTGGIGAENIREYLSQKFVAAIGGSWMMKGTEKDIERLSAQAVNAVEEMGK